ncbi:MAG: STAS domain-containing protein [Candidatus Lindowbacteria bacterium]|nr:STAS domain-containing protein [Candidatus Lindowbacteria bacterium]
MGRSYIRMDEIPVLVLSGDIGATEVELARKSVLELMSNGKMKLLVELSAVEIMTSPGVGFMASLSHSYKSRGGRVVFVRPAPFVREIMKVSGLLGLVEVQESMEEAEKVLTE